MKRWRLIVMPLVVAAVGIWAANYNRPPQELPLGKSETDPAVSKEKIDQPKPETLETILENDPVRFLTMSLQRYDERIKGYALTFEKHERIAGKLRKPEKVEVRFREKPFSVHMTWIENTADQASRVLYVEGENDGKLLGRSSNFLLKLAGAQPREVDGPEAKSSGRFTIAQFGFKKSTERTYARMKDAQERGKLFVKYEGIVPVEKLGGQKCYKLIRAPFEPYEEDGLNELTVYYDTEYLLQVGAILKDAKGQLLGEYFFSDLKINPEFEAKQFTRDAV